MARLLRKGKKEIASQKVPGIRKDGSSESGAVAEKKKFDEKKESDSGEPEGMGEFAGPCSLLWDPNLKSKVGGRDDRLVYDQT